MGGDIFLHGKCVTAGCLPLTDDKIKELYLYAVLAHSNGQQHIPVYLLPFRMTDQNLTGYTHIYQENPGLIAFWKNLKQGYDTFTFSKAELPVSVNTKGEYVF